jgi:GNAT superfamily N-acetyltransferase
MVTGADLAWRAEHLFLNAFPAPVQVLMGDMVARLGGGVSRRACSVNPLRAEVRDFPATLAACERLYAARDLPCRVRVPHLLDPAIDGHLASLGYGVECDVRTMMRPTLDNLGPIDRAAILTDRPDAPWLAALDRVRALSPAQSADYRASLDAMGIPRIFAALADGEGTIRALAFAGIQHGLVAVEGVFTEASHRGQGLSRRLLAALLDRARTLGAGAALLQVQAENAPAVALYERLGFDRDLHRYHFRRQDRPRGAESHNG